MLKNENFRKIYFFLGPIIEKTKKREKNYFQLFISNTNYIAALAFYRGDNFDLALCW